MKSVWRKKCRELLVAAYLAHFDPPQDLVGHGIGQCLAWWRHWRFQQAKWGCLRWSETEWKIAQMSWLEVVGLAKILRQYVSSGVKRRQVSAFNCGDLTRELTVGLGRGWADSSVIWWREKKEFEDERERV
jgi:hypothetical protein